MNEGQSGLGYLLLIALKEPWGRFLRVQSRRVVSHLTPLWGMSYGPGSSRQRPHDSGGPSSATSWSEESVRALARRYGISPTTVQKWRKRETTADMPMGPAEPKSTVLSLEQEAMIVAFRRHTLLALDDCLYALQPPPPGPTRLSP